LPQSRRLRPEECRDNRASRYPASRLPQSRRLRRRRQVCRPDRVAPPQDCRSRGDCGQTVRVPPFHPASRLKIAAVAATAASALSPNVLKPETASRLPQSRRLRHGCGPQEAGIIGRLKIAAVAATAARHDILTPEFNHAASRLPQSRRLRRFPDHTDV